MKKVYLGLVMVMGCGVAVAQVNTSFKTEKVSRNATNYVTKASKTNNIAKAEGDEIWANDFSTVSDWSISNMGASGSPVHTSGDWAIVNAMPTSLTSQAGAYGFPTAIGSVSGGNFALIDSDAEGGAASQNAMITVATPIDVAALLSGNGSPADAALLLNFTNIYRHYYDLNFVEVSNDNGVTWTTFAVNAEPEVPVNTNSEAPEYESVNITAATGGGNWSSTVLVRFRYVGQWDWFWGIDDVALVEAWNNEITIQNFYQSTDIATTQALDYYIVPESQVSFPGLTFGAMVVNNGGMDQASVALNATDGGTYDETGTGIAIASGSADSISVTVPYMLPTAVGSYNLDFTTVISGADAVPANNEESMTIVRDEFWYARDNGVSTGGISQVSSQDGVSLAIGNLMEIFDETDATSMQIRLLDQAAAEGQVIRGLLYVYNETTQEFDYATQTDDYIIQAADLDNFVTLPLFDVTTLPAGALVLVMAQHDGGTTEVGFAYAQPCVEGTVLGITADGEFFTLLTPNAIMVRLSDDPSAATNNLDLEGVSIYPNPSTGEINVTNDLNIENTITVMDLTGKVVATKVASSSVKLDLTTVGTGVYMVEVANANGKKVERVVIR